MNKTEKKSYKWLVNHGAKEIKFNRMSSPDFETDIGNFEVKTIHQFGYIYFTKKQIEIFIMNPSIKILVYPAKTSEPEVLSFNELANFYAIRANE